MGIMLYDRTILDTVPAEAMSFMHKYADLQAQPSCTSPYLY